MLLRNLPQALGIAGKFGVDHVFLAAGDFLFRGRDLLFQFLNGKAPEPAGIGILRIARVSPPNTLVLARLVPWPSFPIARRIWGFLLFRLRLTGGLGGLGLGLFGGRSSLGFLFSPAWAQAV